MAPPNTPSTATPAANNDNSEIIMSINHPAAATASVEAAGINNHLDGNQASSSSSNNNPQQNPKSVVPQLMDIYDDLTQSSTPQTTTVPGLPLPKGVYYSGNHQSFDTSSSQTSNERSGSRRRSGSKSQYTNGGGVASSTVPATTTSGTSARSQRKSTTRKVKASEMMMEEEYLPNKQGGGSRKKGKTSSADPRWSKRFTWPDELHRDFVSAIFDVGLKHSSPSAIMEFMRPNNPDVTSERVKSHLQKYRKNRGKSRKEFMTSYDSALEGFQKRQLVQVQQKQQQGGEQQQEEDTIEGGCTNGGGSSMNCGEVAAHCTHVSLTGMNNDSNSDGSGSPEERGGSRRSTPSLRSTPVPGMAPMSNNVSQNSQVSMEGIEGGVGTLRMPLLTTQEKDGHIGQAFGYLVGLHQVLSHQLEASRCQQQVVSSSSQNQTAIVAHQHAEPPQPMISHQYPPPQHQQQVYNNHQTLMIQPIVEQAAATAASSILQQQHAVNNVPSIHEVAASIPHVFNMGMGTQPAVQPLNNSQQQRSGYNAGGGHPPQQQHHTQPSHHNQEQHHAPPPQQQHQQHSQVQASSMTSSNAPHSSSHPQHHAQPQQHQQQHQVVSNAPHSSSHPQQQQHHAAQPQHQQQHPQVVQAPSNHYNAAGAPSAPQDEYDIPPLAVQPPPPIMQQQQPQHYAYGGAPSAPQQPAYNTHPQQQRAVAAPPSTVAPSNSDDGGQHHHHQQQAAHAPQKYLPANPQQSYLPHEIPAISHHGQQPLPQGQPAFVPPMINAPALMAMHHPTAPQSSRPVVASAPQQTYGNKVSQEQYLNHQHHADMPRHHHQAPPPPSNPSHPKESSAPPTAAVQQPISEVNGSTNLSAGTGRTLQAQKESTMMKQEMRGQMVFQNKIRALKQIELSKYGGKEQPHQQHRRSSSNDISGGGHPNSMEDMNAKPAAAGEFNNGHPHSQSSHHHEGEHQQPSELTTGGATSPSQHQLSETFDEELFWDPEDDDQIFDFLMEH